MKIGTLFIASLLICRLAAGQEKGATLPAWKEGYLDIHFINIGEGGNASFLVMPDGTTMLVDIGDMKIAPDAKEIIHIKANREKTVPELVEKYVRQFHPDTKKPVIDYALITHFHSDHFGEIHDSANISTKGKYNLFGITALYDKIPFGTMIDRAYPDYNFPNDLAVADKSIGEYIKFVRYQVGAGHMQAQKFKVGVADQLVLKKKPAAYPGFSIRNICGNGVIWTGEKELTTSIIHPSSFAGSPIPNENHLSNGMRISYGNFDYFTGGDLPGYKWPYSAAWDDVESHVAPVIGPVDVACFNHHGWLDAQNEFYVRTVRPRVWVGQVWHASQPGEEVLYRVASTVLYPGPRDVFTTNMHDANFRIQDFLIEKVCKATYGHIVVRVAPGGKTYKVVVLDPDDAQYKVKSVFGPYESR
ncbi:hypothetical protein [Chitinophaga sp. MM2321]|uniref:hypothetical protein n=1 Tax=Chitinophaga sp. MM2321 TaxID=3137178 RepID=UPI0032D580E7